MNPTIQALKEWNEANPMPQFRTRMATREDLEQKIEQLNYEIARLQAVERKYSLRNEPSSSSVSLSNSAFAESIRQQQFNKEDTL